MGGEARIVLYALSQKDADTAFHGAFARIAHLEDVMSDYRAESELSRLNAAAGKGPQPVSGELFEVLARALELATRTDGAFDPTVGPLTSLWREVTTKRPDPEWLRAVARHVGYAKLRLDEGARTAELTEPGMKLDLGAIGKGFACDRALELLRSRGIAQALVQLGGDIAVGDPPPGKRGWEIRAGDRTLEIAGRGVGTSGGSERHHEIDGVRYSHVVTPGSGEASTHRLTMTVVAPDATISDALATAADVLGRDAGAMLATYGDVELLVDDPEMRSLFDGRSLAGWTTKGGRYDGDARWSVEDGCIVGRVNEKGEGGLLYTERPYTSFEFECDVRLDHPFDSGVFVRMVPPTQDKKGAQITLDDRKDGEIGAVYADGFLVHGEPTPGKLWHRDAWNHVRVEVTGFDFHVRAWINGGLATDYALPAGTPGYAPTGLLGIQVHGGMGEPKESAARFKELRIRELPVFGEEADAAWSPLFDGRSLDGWEEHGTQGAWRVHDGVLGCLFGKEGGDLRTKEDFRDFDLRLEFKIARMANSGVFLRAKRDDSNPAFSGCEIQILDDSAWEKETRTTLKPWQFTGSLYGSVPANAPGLLRPVGEWNAYEILCRGSRIAVALNGRTLYDVDTTKVEGDPPFAARAPSGFIGLQRHDSDGPAGEDAVAFRNVLVRR
jgi:thiamine biosynthesis lipoprotein